MIPVDLLDKLILQDEIRELRSARVAQQQLLKICRNDTALAEKVNGFANKLGLKEKAARAWG